MASDRQQAASDRLRDLRAQLESIGTGGADAGREVVDKATALAREALCVAQDALEDTGAAALGGAEVVLSGAADGLDEARDSVRGRPIASLLVAVGIGIVLGRWTANNQADRAGWLW